MKTVEDFILHLNFFSAFCLEQWLQTNVTEFDFMDTNLLQNSKEESVLNVCLVSLVSINLKNRIGLVQIKA